jgi:hypothetical protein
MTNGWEPDAAVAATAGCVAAGFEWQPQHPPIPPAKAANVNPQANARMNPSTVTDLHGSAKRGAMYHIAPHLSPRQSPAAARGGDLNFDGRVLHRCPSAANLFFRFTFRANAGCRLQRPGFARSLGHGVGTKF